MAPMLRKPLHYNRYLQCTSPPHPLTTTGIMLVLLKIILFVPAARKKSNSLNLMAANRKIHGTLHFHCV